MIEAADSNVQVGSNIHASMEELHAVEGVSILRTSSQDPHEDFDFDHRFPIHPVDQIAQIPTRMVPPLPPDHLFATSVVPPAPPDHLFVDNWWNYAPYNFEYIQHDGYPGPNAPSELSTEPRTSLRTQTSRGSNEQTDDSSLDKKPPATSAPKKKGRGTGKQTPKKKTKPRKIRTRAHRSSNGSSSSSSPSATSAGAKNAGSSPEPDAEELQEAKTERARQALKNWHERLNDLIRFRLEHGHGKFGFEARFRTRKLFSPRFCSSPPRSQCTSKVLGEDRAWCLGEQATYGEEGVRRRKKEQHDSEENSQA
jgi:hypothetical protein